MIRLFREQDKEVLHRLLETFKMALVRRTATVQYEASTLPAAQMSQKVPPEKFTKQQQCRSRLDGGVELDGTSRQLLEVTEEELPGHHVLEKRRAAAEGRAPPSYYSQAHRRYIDG